MDIELDDKALDELVKKKTQMIGDAFGILFRQHLADEAPVNTAYLKDNINYKVEDDRVIFIAPIYALYLENGAKPHMPPVDAIKHWAHLKFGLNGKELNQAAWAISINMARHGMQPNPFISRAVNQYLVSDIQEAFRIVLR